MFDGALLRRERAIQMERKEKEMEWKIVIRKIEDGWGVQGQGVAVKALKG